MVSLPFRTFASGEIAPALYGRADLSKYQSGLKTLRNFQVMRHGGVTNRAGFEFVAEVKDSTTAARIKKFVFNDEQTYLLEFGNLYVRFVRNGAQITETAKIITGATAASPVVITSVAHGFSNGDEVVIAGVLGMTEINGRNFKVANVAANTFELQTMDGSNLDGSAFTAYASAGTASRVYTVTTPYTAADVAALNIVQSADVLTLTHPSYATRELARTSDTSWTLTAVTFSPSIAAPDDVVVTAGAVGTKTFRYAVTSIKVDTFEESVVGLSDSATATAFDRTVSPWSVTCAAHPFATGDRVLFTVPGGAATYSGITNQTFTITSTGAGTFTLDGTVADSGVTASHLASKLAYAKVTSAATPTAAAPIVITWSAVTDAAQYTVYKELNGIYGYIGVATGTRFEDINYTPGTTDTPPEDRHLFAAVGDYPSVAGYFQQRLLLANTDNEPEKIWGSQIGNYHNFTQGTPIQDDDPVTFTPAGAEVNEVRAMMDLGKLILFTAGGIYAALGNADGAVIPSSINLRLQAAIGCSTLQPIPVGTSALFIESLGSEVHDLNYNLESDGYRGNELSVFSAHLFEGKTIVDWAYQRKPHSIVWMVRDDGVLLGLTYMRAQEVIGWHHHDTQNGFFESVCSLPEGDEHAVYVVVRRVIDGRTVRYIERMHSRYVGDIRTDAFFVDSGLTYDGRHTGSITMTLTGTTYAFDEDMTLTSSAGYFTALKVGNAIELVLYEEDGTTVSARLKCTITDYTSSASVTVHADRDVPAAFQAVAIEDWSEAADVISGLHHLEGETVAILADGNELTQQVVTDGQVTLDEPYSVVHVGLPIEADVETLALEIMNAETLIDKKKLVNKATVLVESSRAMMVGPDEDHLTAWVQRNETDTDGPIEPFTGPVEVLTNSTWNTNGQVFIRQSSPLPLTILAIVPSGRVGG